ncbi:MAG: hypothetical protein ABR501_12235, partial [Pyrinomonadaceae bacterium]
GVFLNLLGAPKGAWIRAAASPQPLGATRMIHNILLTIALALTLEVSLRPQQASQSADPAKKNSANTATDRLYLLGRFHWNKRTVSDLRKAIEYFQQAVITDPNYAPAYAGLADSYMLLSESDGAAPREVIPKARQAALKASIL